MKDIFTSIDRIIGGIFGMMISSVIFSLIVSPVFYSCWNRISFIPNYLHLGWVNTFCCMMAFFITIGIVGFGLLIVGAFRNS